MTAVKSEAAWLAAHGDNLPSLLAVNGGPWTVIQAYQPRTPAKRETALYVMRAQLDDVRFSNQRRLTSHMIRVRARWPIGATTTGTDIWEAEQEAFDNAIDLLLQRVRGTMFDHTHGGRFLSVAEAPDPGRITVRFTDPEQTAAGQTAALLADVTYSADSPDFAA